jgi:molybdopterin-guanine dinucleotide biosynthesis protein A
MATAAPPPRLAGLALAGGRSSRFGSEKAVALFRGRPLLAWSLEALEAVCGVVAAAAAATSGAAALARAKGLTVLADDPRHPAGPLSGIAAGLAWAAGEDYPLLAVLPCDCPCAGAEEIGALLAALGDAEAAFAATADGPQALVSVWRTTLADALAGELADGRHPPVRAALANFGARQVDFPDPARFWNVNSAGDLARLEAGAGPTRRKAQ